MQLGLAVLPSMLGVTRLDPDTSIPDWVGGELVSITRTASELSIVCADAVVPVSVQCERGWRALRVDGPIPFETTGVAAALLAPLAAAGISVFLISTYDTDYLLVKSESLERVVEVLREAGHSVR